jgi:hypothetical protein
MKPPEQVAYTPRAEFQCDGSTTHYQGCKCHEERWQAEVADAKNRAECFREGCYELRSQLAQAMEALTEIAAWDFLSNASQWPSMKIARAALERMGERKGEG